MVESDVGDNGSEAGKNEWLSWGPQSAPPVADIVNEKGCVGVPSGVDEAKLCFRSESRLERWDEQGVRAERFKES